MTCDECERYRAFLTRLRDKLQWEPAEDLITPDPNAGGVVPLDVFVGEINAALGETIPQEAVEMLSEGRMKGRIVRNRCQCAQCRDIIESCHRHDFVRCGCGAIFTDGGKSYIRRGEEIVGSIIDLTEWETES